ncbi:uncharacterized protein MONBRDRAFT_37173 [Monosiga brevicollis MX1]|uniref:DNA-directed RNA polymerase III subunit n=1 Tax=Monosiga brevicollis TaxID=81824 RepID=A9V022_MONBE|nr:uncharacterized protein MONBRDRAFT_37173 [Monosiga brevicollis MX1]EDQ89081.1 predicted protein [Monosiga brevicollis MX1]|eukprot:XP_001746186.1 hypothetical protein [Monosiga brevicollis MX1]
MVRQNNSGQQSPEKTFGNSHQSRRIDAHLSPGEIDLDIGTVERYADASRQSMQRKQLAASMEIWDQGWGIPTDLMPPKKRRAAGSRTATGDGATASKLAKLRALTEGATGEEDEAESDEEDELGSDFELDDDEEDNEEGGDYLQSYYENEDDTYERQEEDTEETF